ncbi:hypothetical protein MBLNU459_g6044t1 [Dothideomycetes sp. NU459]
MSVADQHAPASGEGIDKSRPIRIGTRKSPLAQIQAYGVSRQLSTAHPDIGFQVQTVTVRGDVDKSTPFLLMANTTSGTDAAKNIWAEEMEAELRHGNLDMLVNCLKDMPTTLPDGFLLGAVVGREDPTDALVMRAGSPFTSLEQLPDGAVIGTSSTRRKAILRRLNPRFDVRECRGNVDTRLRKLDAADGPFSAIVVATAGLVRLGLQSRITERMSPAKFPYAVGQGTLGIEIRKDDTRLLQLLGSIETKTERWTCLAERSLLRNLQGGCSSPVGVSSIVKESHDGESLEDGSPHPRIRVELHGSVIHPQGSSSIDASAEALLQSDDDAEKLGAAVANSLVQAGAGELLAEIRTIGHLEFKANISKGIDNAQANHDDNVSATVSR